MGAGGSKANQVAPQPNAASGKPEENIAVDATTALQATVENKLILDAHLHYAGYMQNSEGVDKLVAAMDKNGVGYSVCTGCSFKKTWVGECKDDYEPKDKPPLHHLYDDGDLYHYSACDGSLFRALKTAGPAANAKLSMLACGVNLGDYSAGELVKDTLATYPGIKGIGELVLQSDDINNVTVKGGNWTYTAPAIKAVIDVCAATDKKNPLPLIIYSDARSTTTKPYRLQFEYVDEIEMVCNHAAAKNPNMKVLWVGAGVMSRGNWKDYTPVLKVLVEKHKNLFISLTPTIVSGAAPGISREDALNLAEDLAHRIVLGTQIKGVFLGSPPKEFLEMSYEAEVAQLKKFADQIEVRCGKSVAAWLRYRTAAEFYGLAMPKDPDASAAPKPKADRGATLKGLMHKEMSAQGGMKHATSFLSMMAYGGAQQKVCPPSLSGKTWDTIDCHLHLLDFLQKSSGTTAALKAMDGCDCKKAVVFGMPCCKKWCFYRPEQPLYYQDDNGPCYVYAYADQMVADAWLALNDTDRARLAPCFASFDPTDLAALAHVKRLYYKYPKMWRGIGEVMCRHDDLTTMLLGKEIPRVNHPALDFIYKFAIEVDLPVLVHHNSDRVGDKDESWEYIHEVEEVLKKFPKLKFTWVHAGVSRRCSEEKHYQMISDMCSKYDNLKVDISWVVWEDVICDSDGKVKPQWVECIQKHHTKFFIGSDNVAQYFPIMDTTMNLLAGNITKYYQLFEQLTEEAGNNVAYGNAQREYFENWDVPSGDSPGTAYARMPSYYDTECLDPSKGAFVMGATDLDDDGKY